MAHETAHALLDGLHRRYQEPTNPDVLAFHEAFADIVALFQHFTLPEALKDQIGKTRGDLRHQNLLGQLAVQFGHAIGGYGALRDAIGAVDDNGVWQPARPSLRDYNASLEPHARGSVLVAAVFDAFLQIYASRTADLIRIATGGTGMLQAISADLVDRLAQEAAKAASHVLQICIRALDYCPPIDITFGDYLRALVTADRDVAPDDPYGYRVAFVSAFRARGITPQNVRSLSPSTLAWEPPPQPLANLAGGLAALNLDWALQTSRRHAFEAARDNARRFHDWLVSTQVSDGELAMLGLVRTPQPLSFTLDGQACNGALGGIEVHSVRPARRVGPDRTIREELIVEITQTWRAAATPDAPPPPVSKFRGGCTLIIDLRRQAASYFVRKGVDRAARFADQATFTTQALRSSLRATYGQTSTDEPFAALHRDG